MLVTLDSLSVGGGYAYSGAPVVDGVEYILTGLKGWEGSPAPKTNRTARPGTHGSFRGDAFRDVRSFEVSGVASSVTRSHTISTLANRRLRAICSKPDRLYRMDVNDDVSTLSSYVELDGEILTDPREGFDWSFTFSIPLAASDPRLYGPWQSVSAAPPTPGTGGVDSSTGAGVVSTGSGVDAGTDAVYSTASVSNTGTAPGLLVAQFIGPATNPIFINTLDGRQVMLRGVLESGMSLWVNMSPQDAYEIPGMPDGSYLEGRTVSDGFTFSGGGSLTVANGIFPDFPEGSSATYKFFNGQGIVHARPAYW